MSTLESLAARHSFAPAAGRPDRTHRSATGAFARAFATLMRWQARHRERAHLAQLDDHLLRDMGLTRAEVARQVAKPFWQA